ncbi:MAG: hypothetical protein KHX48_09195 [Alistipes sp.]|nr:hypothetical protein [Alistipes sp.]
MENKEINAKDREVINEVLQRDLTFRYQLLGRLQSDCEYYLNYGNRNVKRLWAGSERLQIELMTELHKSFKEDEKPQWLSMDEIIAYGRKML